MLLYYNTERERALELNFCDCVVSGTYVAELWLFEQYFWGI